MNVRKYLTYWRIMNGIYQVKLRYDVSAAFMRVSLVYTVKLYILFSLLGYHERMSSSSCDRFCYSSSVKYCY